MATRYLSLKLTASVLWKCHHEKSFYLHYRKMRHAVNISPGNNVKILSQCLKPANPLKKSPMRLLGTTKHGYIFFQKILIFPQGSNLNKLRKKHTFCQIVGHCCIPESLFSSDLSKKSGLQPVQKA